MTPDWSASSIPASTEGMNSEGIAALDRVDEVEPFARRRLHVDDRVAVLPATAGLADEAALDLPDRLADRLAVGDLRPADVCVDRELAQEAVDDHLEVELAHPVDQGLPGFLIGFDLEGRVLLGEAGQAGAELLLVRLGLRLDRHGDHRLGELDLLELDRGVRRAERVPRRSLLQADASEDVAGVALLDLLAVVGVHHQQAPDPLGSAVRGVEHAAPSAELAGVHPEVGELADVGIRHHLEGEGGEGASSAAGRSASVRPPSAPFFGGSTPLTAGTRGAKGGAPRSRRAAAGPPCS